MRALLPPLAFLVVVRVALWAFSAPVQRHVPALVVPQRPHGTGVPRWLTGWANWDGGWYLAIAEHGYAYVPDGQSSTAFLPLYPLTIRALAELGLDPLELRLRNAVQQGDRMANGVMYPRIGCKELEEAMQAHPHYHTPLEAPDPATAPGRRRVSALLRSAPLRRRARSSVPVRLDSTTRRAPIPG